MAESRVGFLHQIVSCLPRSENNESMKLLRSFYLMRCKETTLSCGLPTKPFSSDVRCPRCCLKWDKKSYVEIKPIKLSTRQKQRSKKKSKKTNIIKPSLQSNQLEQTCSFCKHTTVTTVAKPKREYPQKNKTNILGIEKGNSKLTATIHSQAKAIDKNTSKLSKRNNVESYKRSSSNTNVYSNAFDVFSLKNKQNTLASTTKEPPKIIKNNKKKKDKFAGLCQKAVIASAKLKEEKSQEKIQNKLSLFLKPSG